MSNARGKNRTGKKSRLRALDSLRGLAALNVVLCHYKSLGRPMDWLLAPFYNDGSMAVYFFFVLSGFVLYYAYATDERKSEAISNIFARFVRFFPLQFITLLIAAFELWILQAHLTQQPALFDQTPHIKALVVPLLMRLDWHHFLAHLTLMNQIGLQNGLSFNLPAWSISTEFIVNILFLLTILLPMRIAIPAFWTYAIAGLGIYIWHFDYLSSNMLIGGILNTPLLHAVIGFFFGALAYKFYAKRKKKWADSLCADVLIAIMVGLLCVKAAYASIIDMIFPDIWFVLLCPCLLVAVQCSYYTKRFLQLEYMVFIGNISYAIYLVHFCLELFYIILMNEMHGSTAFFATPWFLIFHVGLTIAAAAALRKYVELPAKKWLQQKSIRPKQIKQAKLAFKTG